MLLFRSEETVNLWCEAHRVPRRPLIDLQQLWFLRRPGYGNRLTVESRGRRRTRWHRFRLGRADRPVLDPKADVWSNAR
jgi:hypothetical protein